MFLFHFSITSCSVRVGEFGNVDGMLGSRPRVRSYGEKPVVSFLIVFMEKFINFIFSSYSLEFSSNHFVEGRPSLRINTKSPIFRLGCLRVHLCRL